VSLSIHPVVAGNDATRTAIGWGIDALTQVSELRARWIADFDGVTPTAVEEIVRWASPVIVMRRTLAGAATLGGQEPNAGDKVLILYWADNRDFMRQDQLNLMRKPNHTWDSSPAPKLLQSLRVTRFPDRGQMSHAVPDASKA